jgi:hypothetical protein
MGYRLVGLLMVLWKAEECYGMEDGAYLSLLVFMEEKKQYVL